MYEGINSSIKHAKNTQKIILMLVSYYHTASANVKCKLFKKDLNQITT